MVEFFSAINQDVKDCNKRERCRQHKCKQWRSTSLARFNERLTSLIDHLLYANVYLVFSEGFLTLGAPIDLFFDFIMHWVIGEIHHSKAHGKIIQSDKILAVTFIT
jgi:hypothetical protein